MRILITADTYPPEIGGTATHVSFIAEGLAQQGHAVRVLVGSRDPSAPPVLGGLPYTVERVDVRRPKLRTTLRLFAHVRWAQVVYDNGLLGLLGDINWWLRKSIVARVAGDSLWEHAVLQGWTADDFETFQRRRYGRFIEHLRQRRREALRKARAVVVPCTYLRDVVGGWGIPAERIRVIPPGFAPAPEEPGLWPAAMTTAYRLVTAGRLTPWQGIEELLAAIMPWEDVGLLVIGDGPQRASLEELARRLGLGQRVHFVGRMERPALLATLRAADLFVYNARCAGQPHILFEAWAAGVPVVAAAVGGIPELISDRVDGRWVPVGDRAALRQTIRELLDDPLMRASLRSAGRAALGRYGAALARTADALGAERRVVDEVERA
jgi:glycosyltransferase involved in cell wall biosynthesis